MDKINRTRIEIIKLINKHLGTDDYLLFCFGSFVKGNLQKSSDIDLAIYKKNGFFTNEFQEIKEALNEQVKTLRDIDFINLNNKEINKDLLENILKEGVIWNEGKNSKELLKDLKRRLINLKK